MVIDLNRWYATVDHKTFEHIIKLSKLSNHDKIDHEFIDDPNVIKVDDQI